MQQLIQIERSGSVAVLRLNRGTINAIDLDLVRGLSDCLGLIRKEPSFRALVLGSANHKFFSIGLDIPWLYPLSVGDFTDFYKAFNRLCLDLYAFPKPTVAALTGHAVAGGGILVSCCDYRFIAEGHNLLGINEIKLGVPMPYPADRIIHDLLGGRTARNVMDSGDFYLPDELLRMGWVDRVLPEDEVIPASVEKAEELGALPSTGFSGVKKNRVDTVMREVLAHLEERETAFIEAWYSEQARARLEEAMKKFQR
jgi:enoyl-CoA hydratase/carnithine racemase